LLVIAVERVLDEGIGPAKAVPGTGADVGAEISEIAAGILIESDDVGYATIN
jgi:hypothetical protein